MRLGLTRDVLDSRLQAESRRPLAVAFSGGGDSLALLLEADAWAKRTGRQLLVLSVDHGLQRQSEAWTAACAATAARLGLAFQALAWTGEKPATGLSAAARVARHRLLADAAREAGASVILMGHTADDILEARLMRTRGATTPEPREWAPSPAWPQGRGVFLLRPLLGLRRAEIRAWLAARGESWIEDPANESPLSIRARARREIAGGGLAPEPRAEAITARDLAVASDTDISGAFWMGRDGLRRAGPGVASRFLAFACLCAAGTDRPPGGKRVLRLAERVAGPDSFTATLAGARIAANDREVQVTREAGEAARGGMAPLRLAAGETGVWDGRFEIAADRAMEVRAAAGLRSQLSRSGQKALAALPASVRDTVPVIFDPVGPRLADATPLTYDRLLAACGAVAREPA